MATQSRATGQTGPKRDGLSRQTGAWPSPSRRVVYQNPGWVRLDCHRDDGLFALVAVGCNLLGTRRAADQASCSAGARSLGVVLFALVSSRWLSGLSQSDTLGLS